MIDIDELIETRTAISFYSKDEAVECVRKIREEVGGRLYRDQEGFYSRGDFYDGGIIEYGNIKENPPAICLDHVDCLDEDGVSYKYRIGYCSEKYFRDRGYFCAPYCSIRDELFGIEHDMTPGNDVSMLFS